MSLAEALRAGPLDVVQRIVARDVDPPVRADDLRCSAPVLHAMRAMRERGLSWRNAQGAVRSVARNALVRGEVRL